MMLPAKYRLKSRKKFHELFLKGKTVSNNVVLMKCAKSGTGDLKIGFSVGLKFSKKAFRRNRVKRWMREAVRPMLKEIELADCDIIFLINPKFPYEQMNYGLIREKIRDLLGRAKLLK